MNQSLHPTPIGISSLGPRLTARAETRWLLVRLLLAAALTAAVLAAATGFGG